MSDDSQTELSPEDQLAVKDAQVRELKAELAGLEGRHAGVVNMLLAAVLVLGGEYIYAIIPSVFLGVVPVVSAIFAIYGLYLYLVAGKNEG